MGENWGKVGGQVRRQDKRKYKAMINKAQKCTCIEVKQWAALMVLAARTWPNLGRMGGERGEIRGYKGK